MHTVSVIKAALIPHIDELYVHMGLKEYNSACDNLTKLTYFLSCSVNGIFQPISFLDGLYMEMQWVH